VQRLEINLLETPAHSRRILQHLLSSDWGASELHDFLLDGGLHTKGSNCFEELIEWKISKPNSKAHVESFYVCMQKSLNLGLFPGREVQILISKLAKVNTSVQGTTTELGGTEAIQGWYWMMADAMTNCPVFSLKDLGQNVLQQWCQLLLEAPFAPCALDTFLTIQRCLMNVDRFKVNTIQGLVKKWITYAQRSKRYEPSDLTRTEESELDYAKVADFLAALRPSLTSKSLCEITGKLVRDVVKGARLPTALDMWMHILSCYPGWSADMVLNHQKWRDCQGEYASASGLASPEGIVVRLWTATRLAKQAREPHDTQGLQKLIQRLVHLLEQQLGPDQDLLAGLIFTLQSLPLPSPSDVLQMIGKYSGGHFQFHGSTDKLLADMLDVSNSRIALFKEDGVYKNAKVNLNTYLRTLAERANTNPEGFLQVARALIMRDRLSFKIITRILRHNLALNLSLAYAPVPTRMQSSRPQMPTSPTTVASKFPDPATSLYILNSLARSFAVSPAISPRQAFRKVYWIYLHLHKHTWGNAIGPEITRSLWHAGVTRYKETGTSPEKVGWILSKVREVEGQEVADRLLWFGSGGVKGWKEWMRQDCDGIDAEGWKRVVGKRTNRQKQDEDRKQGEEKGLTVA